MNGKTSVPREAALERELITRAAKESTRAAFDRALASGHPVLTAREGRLVRHLPCGGEKDEGPVPSLHELFRT